jgi:uncharacterized protein YgbK (DUF1537 family)
MYADRDVLVIDTNSRGMTSDRARTSVYCIFKDYNKVLFPIIYKKIDSTLRGNIGFEIDAILGTTNIEACFMAPSYPEQNRTLVGGVMMVGGKPLSLTEAAHDMAAPVKESYVHDLIERQSSNKVGRIDITSVATDPQSLSQNVQTEEAMGNTIIVFDAVNRVDLTNIVEVGFGADKRPLFVGSAGLAEEVAKKLTSFTETKYTAKPLYTKLEKAQHVFIVSGSLSSITRKQLDIVAQRNIAMVQADNSFLTDEERIAATRETELSCQVADALSKSHVILTTPTTRLSTNNSPDVPPIPPITQRLGRVAESALRESKIDVENLALIAIGGDTAISVFHALEGEGIKIDGELLPGIAMSHLAGGQWHGLTFITKAGGFGGPNSLEEVVRLVEARPR